MVYSVFLDQSGGQSPSSTEVDMKQDQEAAVVTAVTTEESESETTRDMVTDSGTMSQGDQWVEIGDRIERQVTAYDAAGMVYLALALGNPGLQDHVKGDRQMIHKRVKRSQFVFKDQNGGEAFEVTPTQWRQLKEDEICEVRPIRRGSSDFDRRSKH